MSDAYWDQTVLLLDCDGANGATNFTDIAGFNNVIPRGDAKKSTAHKPAGSSASAYFDGVGDYIDIPDTRTDSRFSVTGDFELEVWFRPDQIGTHLPVISTYNSNWSEVWCYVDVRADGYIEAAFGYNRAILLVSDSPIVAGLEYELSVTRVGNTAKLRINGGEQTQTATSSITLDRAHMVAGGGLGWVSINAQVRFSKAT